MKTNFKFLITLTLIMVLSIAAAVICSAVYSDGTVEWTFENGIVSMQSADGTSGNITINFGSSAWNSFKNANASSIKEINAVNVDGRGTITAISGGVNWDFTALEKITFPSTVTNIFAGSSRVYVFADNPKLATFGPTGTEVGTLDLSGITVAWSEWGWEERQAFMNTAFKKVILPSNVPSTIGIGDQMFKDCTALEEVIIPATVGSISPNAFSGCTALKILHIYGTLNIDSTAFNDCPAVKVYNYGGGTLSKLPTGSTIVPVYSDESVEWTFENGIVSMQSAAGTSGNLTINFGSSAWNTFKNTNASSIKEINAINVEGRGVITAISNGVNWSFTSLEKITFPATVSNVFAGSTKSYVFADNPKLATFGPTGTEVGTLDLSGITVSWSEWGWDERQSFMNTAFEKIILPANVPSTIGIGNDMFKGCTALKEVVIPASVGSISPEAFSGCTALKTLHIYGTPNIDSTAFSGCGAIKVYNYSGSTISNLPQNATVISIYSDGIVEWAYENGIVSMQSADGTSGNITIDFDSSVWTSFKYANASSIKEINAVNVDGRGVITAIRGGVNWDFTALEKITFPSTVTNIFAGSSRVYVFADNPKLATFGPTGTEVGTLDLSGITVAWSEWGWEERLAFMNTAFKKVILPSNVPSTIGIGDQMFKGCTSLEEVIIPATVGSISISAFENCTSLKTVRIEGSPTVDASSFSGCGALKVYLSDSSKVDTSKFPAGSEFIYPPKVQSAIAFDGFKVRISGYNGLRSIFYFNNDLKEQNGFSLVEYGAFVMSSAAKAKYAAEITYENGKSTAPTGGTHFVVYDAITDTYGKILTSPSDVDSNLNATYFAVTVTNYIKPQNMTADLYFAGYEIWKNETTGEFEIIYTDYGTDSTHDADFVETSIYDVSLSMLKNGFMNSKLDKSDIVWDILVKGGAVTLYGGGDYVVKENMTDLAGTPIGNEFKFASVPAVNQTLNGNVLEFTASDVNITLLRDGDEYISVYRGKGSIPTTSRWGTGTFCQLSDQFASDPNSKGFEVSNAVPNPVLSYNIYKDIKTVIIDEGVTEIGTQHFNYLNYITAIIYPDSLTKIGGAAFQGCGSLKTVYKAYTVGEEDVVDVSYVSELAVGDFFNGCRSVKYVRLPETITSIGYEMFQDCISLMSVVCGEGIFVDGRVDLENTMIDTVSDRAFSGDAKITTFMLPATLVNIYGSGTDASFYGCSSESGIVTLYTEILNEAVNKYALSEEFKSYIEYTYN